MGRGPRLREENGARRASGRFEGTSSFELGNALFRALGESPSGVVFSRDDYVATWSGCVMATVVSI